MHYILEKTLIEILAKNIRKHAQLVEQNEERIIEAIMLAQSNETMSYRAAYKSEVETHKKQIAKLDVLLENLYSDKVTGIISEEMFKRFAAKYEQERVDRLQSIEALEKRIAAIKESNNNTATWAKLIKGFSQLETLDADTLLLLIDKIVIGESQHDGIVRYCDINIFYNYVGDIDRLGLNDIFGKGVTEHERQVV